MCCQRPSIPRRFPTFVFPETAPTVGSPSGCTSRRNASGSKTVSPSTITTTGADDAPMPVLRAEALPPFGLRRSRTCSSPSCSTIAAVSSVEPSSTTTTSNSG